MDNNKYNNSKATILLPIFLSLAIIVGIFLGAKLSITTLSPRTIFSFKPWRKDKINEVLLYINKYYVDTVNQSQLVDNTLTELLKTLDPHSSYIPANELQAANEPLQGNFDGIGIEFNILNDTIHVVAVIEGGPSALAGIHPGDKIVTVEGKNFIGNEINNQSVKNTLRGENGTKINLGIARRNQPKLLSFTIERGKIPLRSIDCTYMVNKTTGYIKINRFSASTYDEYLNSFNKLDSQGMKNLIIDLRGNPGGFLNAATNLADEFLEEKKEIVYTQGRDISSKKVYTATNKGRFEKNKLVLLIDEGSASASEILAGAIQDNDRATIVGRRSFGKGLVQEQVSLNDGSAMRLTVARYYTPTGRCIQKSYTDGLESYYKEERDRYKKGELQNADSIKFPDSLKYTTPKGRVLYGGGGIMPDVFVPLDTNGQSSYLSAVFSNGLINQFAYIYADNEREKLKKLNTPIRFNEQFIISNQLLNDFILFAEKNGVKKNEREIKLSEKRLKIQLKAAIARNIWSNNGYYPVINTDDATFQKALELMNY